LFTKKAVLRNKKVDKMSSNIKIMKVIPMNHAEKCVVCGGSGIITVSGGLGTTAINKQKTCHACNGEGWIAVPNFTDEHLAIYLDTFGSMVIKDEYEK